MVQTWYLDPSYHVLPPYRVSSQSGLRNPFNRQRDQQIIAVACTRPKKKIKLPSCANKPKDKVEIWNADLTLHVLSLYQVSFVFLLWKPSNRWMDSLTDEHSRVHATGDQMVISSSTAAGEPPLPTDVPKDGQGRVHATENDQTDIMREPATGYG